MASIYKDPRTGKYKISYFPRPHLRKVITGCTDYKTTKALADKLENEAWQRRHGIIDTKAERLSNNERLALLEHVMAFMAVMRGRGDTEKHVQRTESYIKEMAAACKFERLSDIDVAKVAAYVTELKRDMKDHRGLSLRTINARLTAFKSFSRWLFRTERMRTDPMMQVAKLNAKTDRRHVRRALTDEELNCLIEAAQKGPDLTWHQGRDPEGYRPYLAKFTITGPERAMLYRLAAETGLRASELGSLTPASFDLADEDKGTVQVMAAYSKHRRDDTLPLRRDLAERLTAYLADRPHDGPAFNVPHCTATMIRADIKRAREAWVAEAKTDKDRDERSESGFLAIHNASGHVLDFHALRHTFITRLARSGVAPAVAKSLARHSTIVLTMDHYTHTLIGDERAALDRLPIISPTRPRGENAKMTGTYDTPVDGRNPVAPRVARQALPTPKLVNTGQEADEEDDLRNPTEYSHLATSDNTGHQWSLCSWEQNRLCFLASRNRTNNVGYDDGFHTRTACEDCIVIVSDIETRFASWPKPLPTVRRRPATRLPDLGLLDDVHMV